MKQEIYITNIKCSGCSNTIKTQWEKIWISHIEIWFWSEDTHLKRKISFEGDRELFLETLKKLWYPEYGSEESKSMMKKLKSFVSCALWKF